MEDISWEVIFLNACIKSNVEKLSIQNKKTDVGKSEVYCFLATSSAPGIPRDQTPGHLSAGDGWYVITNVTFQWEIPLQKIQIQFFLQYDLCWEICRNLHLHNTYLNFAFVHR